MPFVLTKDRKRSAEDPDKKAHMDIEPTADAWLSKAKFTSPAMSFSLPLHVKDKYPNQIKFDAPYPGIMIDSGNLNFFFSRNQQISSYSFEEKTHFAEYLIRMMAFINHHYPFAGAPYFWSDYEDYVAGRKGNGQAFVFRMLSDAELQRLSQNVE